MGRLAAWSRRRSLKRNALDKPRIAPRTHVPRLSRAMIKCLVWVALLAFGTHVTTGCGNNDGSADRSDGDGDASDVIHFVGSPTLVENGHAPVLYGRCASNC